MVVVALCFVRDAAIAIRPCGFWIERDRFVEVAIDSSKSYFDTNNTEHHHYYLEDRHELMDIPPTDVTVGEIPAPPAGYEIARVDVAVRLRRKEPAPR
jgi:Fe2+ or Zn2+ uptake regulation protein